MVDYQQIAIAPFSSIFCDALTVTIARMAVETRLADVGWAQSVEGCLKLSDIAFEELFTAIESLGESHLRDGRGLIFVTTLGDVHRGTQLTASIPFFSSEVAHGLAHVSGFRPLFIAHFRAVVTTR